MTARTRRRDHEPQVWPAGISVPLIDDEDSAVQIELARMVAEQAQARYRDPAWLKLRRQAVLLSATTPARKRRRST